MSNWRVLIVEDDANGRVITRKLLEHNNIQVDAAENAEEALYLLKETPYAAAIIDLSLPGMSGWQLREAMEQDINTMNIPCIAMTAFHSAHVAQEAINAGFTAFLPKPIDLGTLVDDLRQIIETA